MAEGVSLQGVQSAILESGKLFVKSSVVECALVGITTGATFYFTPDVKVRTAVWNRAVAVLSANLKARAALTGFDFVRRLGQMVLRDWWFGKDSLPERVAHIFMGMKFANFYAQTGDTLVHELGHKLAFHAFYQGTATIVLYGSGGHTKIEEGAVSRFLPEIGKFACASGGVLATTCASMIYVALCRFRFDRHFPGFKEYFSLMAIVPLMNTASMQHDFKRLQNMGIHPACFIALFAIAPFVTDYFSASRGRS